MVPASGQEALVERAAGGDQEALTRLIAQHDATLRSKFCNQIPIRWQALLSLDDLLQETYTDAFLDIADFVDRGAESFEHWLTTIGKNNLLNAVQSLEAEKRGGGRVPLSPDQHDSSYAALHELLKCSTTSPSGKAAKAEAKAALEQAIDRLPRDYQTVVRLYDIEGHPVEDVAATMRRSAGAVFMLRARGHRALGRLLGASVKYISDSA